MQKGISGSEDNQSEKVEHKPSADSQAMVFGNDELPDYMVEQEEAFRDTLLNPPRMHSDVVYKKSVQSKEGHSEDLSFDDNSQGTRQNKEELEQKNLQKVKNKD